MKTPRVCLAVGARSPEERYQQYKKESSFEDSGRLIIFVLHMYKTTNLRAKIANICLTAKKMSKKRDCTYRGN